MKHRGIFKDGVGQVTRTRSCLASIRCNEMNRIEKRIGTYFGALSTVPLIKTSMRAFLNNRDKFIFWDGQQAASAADQR